MNVQEASATLGAPFKWLSASQIGTYIDCKRKWGWRYLTGYKDPPAASAQVGSRTHELLELYLTHGTPPNYKEVLELVNAKGEKKTYEPGRIAEAFLPFLPAPGPHLDIEAEFWHAYYYGKVDVAYLSETGVPVVMDHKTTSNIKLYAKTEDDLLADPQAMIYADVAMERTGSNEAYLVWNYGSTSKPYKVKRVALKVLREHSRSVLESLAPTAEEMQTLYKIKAYEEQTQPIETIHKTLTDMVLTLPPSMESCGKYGGCPNITRCAFTSEQLMRAAFAQKGSHSMAEQSFLESFKSKIQAAKEHSAVGAGHLPAPVLPPAPSLPTGLPDAILRSLPPVHEPKMPAELMSPELPSPSQTAPGLPPGFPMMPQVALTSTPPGLPPGFPVTPQVALTSTQGLPPGFPVTPQIALASAPSDTAPGLPPGFPMAPQVALVAPSLPASPPPTPTAPGLPPGFPMAPQVALVAPNIPSLPPEAPSAPPDAPSVYATVPPLPPVQASVSVTVPLAPQTTAEYIQSLNAPEAPKTELAEPGTDDEVDTSDLGATYKHLPKEALVAIAKRNGVDLGKCKEPGIRKKLGSALGPFANHMLAESAITEVTAPPPPVTLPTAPTIPLELLAASPYPVVPTAPPTPIVVAPAIPTVVVVPPAIPTVVAAPPAIPTVVAAPPAIPTVVVVPPATPPVAHAIPPIVAASPTIPSSLAAPRTEDQLTLADMQAGVAVLKFLDTNPMLPGLQLVTRKEELGALISLCTKLLQLPE